MIRSAGARAGLALNPGTAVEPYADLLPEIDMLLLMTVEPGFGGQPFLDLVLPKLRRARALVGGRDAAVWLQVDGGVSEETIDRCAEAGADVFGPGSCCPCRFPWPRPRRQAAACGRYVRSPGCGSAAARTPPRRTRAPPSRSAGR